MIKNMLSKTPALSRTAQGATSGTKTNTKVTGVNSRSYSDMKTNEPEKTELEKALEKRRAAIEAKRSVIALPTPAPAPTYKKYEAPRVTIQSIIEKYNQQTRPQPASSILAQVKLRNITAKDFSKTEVQTDISVSVSPEPASSGATISVSMAPEASAAESELSISVTSTSTEAAVKVPPPPPPPPPAFNLNIAISAGQQKQGDPQNNKSALLQSLLNKTKERREAYDKAATTRTIGHPSEASGSGSAPIKSSIKFNPDSEVSVHFGAMIMGDKSINPIQLIEEELGQVVSLKVLQQIAQDQGHSRLIREVAAFLIRHPVLFVETEKSSLQPDESAASPVQSGQQKCSELMTRMLGRMQHTSMKFVDSAAAVRVAKSQAVLMAELQEIISIHASPAECEKYQPTLSTDQIIQRVLREEEFVDFSQQNGQQQVQVLTQALRETLESSENKEASLNQFYETHVPNGFRQFSIQNLKSENEKLQSEVERLKAELESLKSQQDK